MSDDIEFICIGKIMCYILVSVIEFEGEFVFISFELLKVFVEYVDCINGMLVDFFYIDNVFVDVWVVILFVCYCVLVFCFVVVFYIFFVFVVLLGCVLFFV